MNAAHVPVGSLSWGTVDRPNRAGTGGPRRTVIAAAAPGPLDGPLAGGVHLPECTEFYFGYEGSARTARTAASNLLNGILLLVPFSRVRNTACSAVPAKPKLL